MANNNIIIDLEDSHGMLQFDPAGVVLHRVGSSEPLVPLVDFASKLARHVKTAKAASASNNMVAPAATTQRIRDPEDSDALLQYDTAAVCLNQLGNTNVLNRVEHFVSQITHYLELASKSAEEEVEENEVHTEAARLSAEDSIADTETEEAVPANNTSEMPQGVAIKQEADADPIQPDAIASAEAAVEAATTITAATNSTGHQDVAIKQEEEQTDHFQSEATTNQESVAGETAADDRARAETQQPAPEKRATTSPCANDAEGTTGTREVAGLAKEITPAHGRNETEEKLFSDPAPAQGINQNVDRVEKSTLQLEPGSNVDAIPSVFGAGTVDGSRDVARRSENNEILPEQPASKRQRLAEETDRTVDVVQSENPLEQAPAEIPFGYKGTLAESQLQRSVGLPRTELNRHLRALGLTASFGVPVVSSLNRKISHLTFNCKWNRLPYNEQYCFQWGLGEGKAQVRKASSLNPAEYPNQSAIPIFWAQPPKKGGSLCHYVGHFRCVKFDTTQKVVFKRKPRQAVVEFKFVEFKVDIAEKMSDIAFPSSEDSTGGGEEQQAPEIAHPNGENPAVAGEEHQATSADPQVTFLFSPPGWSFMPPVCSI